MDLKERKKGKSKLEEVQKRDKEKSQLAKRQGIELIRINCNNKFDEEIIQAVKDSKLSKILPLEKVDWVKCQQQCAKSLIKEVCDYYMNNNVSQKEVAKFFKISEGTVARYCKKGRQLGWIKDEIITQRKANICRVNMSKEVCVYNLDGELLGTFRSYKACIAYFKNEQNLILDGKQIPKVLNGDRQEYKGLIFKVVN